MGRDALSMTALFRRERYERLVRRSCHTNLRQLHAINFASVRHRCANFCMGNTTSAHQNPPIVKLSTCMRLLSDDTQGNSPHAHEYRCQPSATIDTTCGKPAQNQQQCCTPLIDHPPAPHHLPPATTHCSLPDAPISQRPKDLTSDTHSDWQTSAIF